MRLTSLHKLLLICIGALVFRLVLLQFVHFPGVADPNHYYNMGVRLVNGHGFTINYIWQYNDTYAAVSHPDDYWMPLTSVLPAVSMRLFGIGTAQAVLPFMLLGSLLPLIGYWAVRQFGGDEDSRLFAAVAVAVLPEFVLNSLRTDTTLPNALLLGVSILLLTEGLRGGRWLAFVGSGIAAGLAYLTRSEDLLLLVMLPMTAALYALWKQPGRWRYLPLIPLIAALIALPWALRTLSINGTLSTPTTGNMFFLTDYRDHYLYDVHLTLQGYLASQTPTQIIGKRLFEMAASVKIMITTLDMFLPVAVLGGLLLMLRERSRRHWMTLSPTLILLLGFFAFYTVLVPFKSQGGSFKKAYLSLIPLLLPLATYAFERAVSDRRLRRGAMALVVGLLAFNAVDLVRLDAQSADNYLASIQKMADVARQLPDRSEDGEIVLMTQDPFILGYVGIPSVVFPFNDRDTVFEVAQRYGVDYLLMPSDRPTLDAMLSGDASDPRFVPVESVPGTPFIFYAVRTQDASGD